MPRVLPQRKHLPHDFADVSPAATVSGEQRMSVLLVRFIHLLLQGPVTVLPPEHLLAASERMPVSPLVVVDKLCAGEFLAELVGLAPEVLLGRGLVLRGYLRFEAVLGLQPLLVCLTLLRDTVNNWNIKEQNLLKN